MDSKDRENKLYQDGKRCIITHEELFMMKLLQDSINSNQKLLDIGCGTGEVSNELKKFGLTVHGIDFSETAIEIARQNGLESSVCDLDKGLLFNNESFDFVWAGDVIEHVFDPIFVISESARVLKKGGKFFATIPYDLSWKVRIKTLLGISYQEGVYRKYGQYKHHSFFSDRLLYYMLNVSNLFPTNVYFMRGRDENKKFSKNNLYKLFSTLMIVEAKKY